MMFYSLSMAKLLLTMIVLGASTMPHQAFAQIACPPGATTKTVIKKMVYNGVCCDIEIVYCEVPGSPSQLILLDATVLDVTCWGLSPGSPPPFSENYLVNVARDLIVRDAFPGTIPTCPTTLNVTIVFSTATCAELKYRVFDPDGPGGEPEVAQLYLSWCSDVLCTRECQVCANPNDIDPCTNTPRVYFQCSPTFNPGCPGLPPNQPTNCQNLCGS